MTLHRFPECTGSWRREGKHYRCNGCQAMAYGCPDVDAAIQVEHAMAHQLRRLTSEGETLRE